VAGGGAHSKIWLVVGGALAAMLPVALGASTVAAGVQVVEHRDLDYEAGLSLDAFLPAAAGRPVPAVLFVHGGGWRSGGKEGWVGRARDLASRTGWAAFTIDYDLDAAEPWVTQPANVRAAIAWVRANAAELGVDPGRIGLVGSSAGGHLAMLVGTTSTGPDRVSAVVSWSGVSDMPRLARTPEGDSLVKDLAARYEGGPLDAMPRRWIDSSPIAHVDPSDPPMLLVGSVDETEVPIDQVTAMHAALEANRVPVVARILPGKRHASQFADDVWRETIQFLRDHL
jgi:acetyl esterase/lipase